MVIPEKHEVSKPDYAQLCLSITKLGDLPTINLSNCTLNIHSLVDPYGSYNVPVDESPSNNGVCNNSLQNVANMSLDSTQDISQMGGSNNSQLGDSSVPTTQVNSNPSSPVIDNLNISSPINHFTVNNVNMACWNIRGFGKRTVNKELNMLCRNINPDIIFLSGTKMNKDLAARGLRNMGFPCIFNVPSIGRSGGLVLAWKKEIHLNIISSSLRGTEDKNGGLEVDDSDFEYLRKFCSAFNLHDPGFSGPRFTWSNMQQGPDLILERLDKFLIKPFHFMDMWIEDPTCRDIIANFWSVNVIGSLAYKLKAKLPSTKKGLRDWNKSSFGNIQTNISTTREEIVDIQTSNHTNFSSIPRLRSRLEYLYNPDELYWKDKSREVWLMKGDKNSPYFHRVTLLRRKRNAISWIKDSSDTIQTDRNSIGTSFINYFKTLYSSHPQLFQDKILQYLPVKFSEADNAHLNSPLSPEEIKNVVFQMRG
ncbi:uncharacterized protein LOC113332872 [Papaver somniferum]|uniref:uncharacterized protein LOC113332872 n=1 Tax=Papaver somniferum TaxID=3469 RepID=UPI000E6FDE55|nr:uncharacterized protein LOC113332872 [Papaver somniferum]